MNNKPIGVFDSGVGGLTVLESLVKKFPNEEFIYVADQGHCPYGTKNDIEIITCITNVIKYLLKQEVKAIVIACNTASLFIKNAQSITDIPIISVIQPTCLEAIRVTQNNNVAVLGTIATINKGVYQKILLEHGKNPVGVACSEFVQYIENEDLNSIDCQSLVNAKLEWLKDKNIDTLIHGCTHFSIIEDKMRNLLGDINYIACGEPTSCELYKLLKEKDLLCDEKAGKISIRTTGSIANAIKTMKWFKLPYDKIVKIEV